MNHEGHEVSRRLCFPGFPSCTFVPFVVHGLQTDHCQRRPGVSNPHTARYSICAMWKRALLLLCFVAPAIAAEKMSAPQLIDLAKSNSANLRDAITASFDAKDLKEGTAWAGHGPDFFFATQAPSQPSLVIDEAPGPANAASGRLRSLVCRRADRACGKAARVSLHDQRRAIRREAGSAGVRSAFLSAARGPIRHAVGKDRSHQQDL